MFPSQIVLMRDKVLYALSLTDCALTSREIEAKITSIDEHDDASYRFTISDMKKRGLLVWHESRYGYYTLSDAGRAENVKNVLREKENRFKEDSVLEFVYKKKEVTNLDVLDQFFDKGYTTIGHINASLRRTARHGFIELEKDHGGLIVCKINPNILRQFKDGRFIRENYKKVLRKPVKMPAKMPAKNVDRARKGFDFTGPIIVNPHFRISKKGGTNEKSR
ncbi:MAG: hypothetical protein IBX55_08935 [Methyloprofundus sp.]|nr:hypothetical protein [Methyloprofundus sp.]